MTDRDPPFCGVCGADLSGVGWTVDIPGGHYDGPPGAWKSCPMCHHDNAIYDLSWDRQEIDGDPVWDRLDEVEATLSEARRGAAMLLEVMQGRPGGRRVLGPILASLDTSEALNATQRAELARFLRSIGVSP